MRSAALGSVLGAGPTPEFLDLLELYRLERNGSACQIWPVGLYD